MTSQIIYCQCGDPATAGRYCLPCLNDETDGISTEELEAAASILDQYTANGPEKLMSVSLNCSCVCHLHPVAFRICSCLCHRTPLPDGQECNCFHDQARDCHCSLCAATFPQATHVLTHAVPVPGCEWCELRKRREQTDDVKHYCQACAGDFPPQVKTCDNCHCVIV